MTVAGRTGVGAHPEAPPSEVEWEDLLVRVELAPRALRLALDDAGDLIRVLLPS